MSRSTKEMALHQQVKQINLQNAENTSAPCFGSAPPAAQPEDLYPIKHGKDALSHDRPNEDQQGCLQLKPSRMVVMQWLTLSMASVQKYTSLTPPNQWTTGAIVPLPKKGAFNSHMTNYTVEYPSCQSVRRCTTRCYSTESY